MWQAAAGPSCPATPAAVAVNWEPATESGRDGDKNLAGIWFIPLLEKRSIVLLLTVMKTRMEFLNTQTPLPKISSFKSTSSEVRATRVLCRHVQLRITHPHIKEKNFFLIIYHFFRGEGGKVFFLYIYLWFLGS